MRRYLIILSGMALLHMIHLADCIAELCAFVPSSVSNSIAVISVPDNTVIRAFNTGEGPMGIGALPNGSTLYTTNADGTVSVIRTSDYAIVNTINIGNEPMGISITPDGSDAYVAKIDGTVSVIRLDNNTVIQTIAVSEHGLLDIDVTPNGDFVYAASDENNTIYAIRTADNAVVDEINLGSESGSLGSLKVSPDGTTVYVVSLSERSLYALQLPDHTIIATINTPFYGGPKNLTITPDGHYIYVANEYDVVSVFSTLDHTETTAISVGISPFGMAVSPDGDFVYVANYGSANVSVIRTLDNAKGETIEVGPQPYASGDFIVDVETIPNVEVPEAPGNLRAEFISDEGIRLSWDDNSTSELGFAIEKREGSNGLYEEVHITFANAVGSTDSELYLEPATTYYYRVRSYNMAGFSDYTDEAEATTASSGSSANPLSDSGGGGCFVIASAI